MMEERERTEAEQLAFYRQFRDAFEQAADRTEKIRFYYSLAGTTVCLCFAGSALVPFLTPALAHLLVEEVSRPDCTIFVWDSESTGVKEPPPPCKRSDFTDRGDIWGFNSSRIKTAFHWSEFSVNLMDLKENEGVYWVRSTKGFPYWVYSSPFRSMFNWWMKKHGKHLLHAAAVGTENGVVLITGKGGSGKSSTAIRCLDAGMLYLGDDYVIVEKDPVPRVYSLYSTAKLAPEDMKLFPSLARLKKDGITDNPEKETLFLYPEKKQQFRQSLPLLAILTPEFADQEHPSLGSVSFWKVQRAISFTTMAQLPGSDHATHDYISALTEALPCSSLLLGSDRERIPEVIRESLDVTALPENQKSILNERDERPLISVVMPVYNGEKFIRKAIENILAQQYPAMEIIVVDDGSSDNTRKELEATGVDVRYFYQGNQGPSAARNWGIRNAAGAYIAFLDVDDFWPDNNLLLLMAELLKHPELDLVRGYAQLVREEEDGRLTYLQGPVGAFPNYIGAGLYRKRAFTKVGLYDPGLIFGEDNDWFYRAGELKINMKRLDEITLFVRRHEGNMTRGKNMVELNALKVFKKRLERKRITE